MIPVTSHAVCRRDEPRADRADRTRVAQRDRRPAPATTDVPCREVEAARPLSVAGSRDRHHVRAVVLRGEAAPEEHPS